MKMEETTGRTEIIKIAEAALTGDSEKARKYIERFIIKYPESDLYKPFENILTGNNNPDGLHLDYSITQG